MSLFKDNPGLKTALIGALLGGALGGTKGAALGGLGGYLLRKKNKPEGGADRFLDDTDFAAMGVGPVGRQAQAGLNDALGQAPSVDVSIPDVSSGLLAAPGRPGPSVLAQPPNPQLLAIIEMLKTRTGSPPGGGPVINGMGGPRQPRIPNVFGW